MSSSGSPLTGLMDVMAAAAASLRPNISEPVVSFEEAGPSDPLSTITGEYALRENNGAGGVSVLQRSVADGMSKRGKQKEAATMVVVIDVLERRLLTRNATLSEGKQLCLGPYGKSSKFCLREDCTTESHRTLHPAVKAWVDDGRQEVLCIMAPTTAGSSIEAAFTEPCVDVSNLSFGSYGSYLEEHRGLSEWSQICAVLQSQAAAAEMIDEDPVSANLEVRLERAAMAVPTPKKRTRELEDDEDESPIQIELRDVLTEAGQDVEPNIRILVKNQHELKRGLDDAKELLHALTLHVNNVAGTQQHIGDRVNLVRVTMGEAPEDQELPTVWQVLSDLKTKLALIKRNVEQDFAAIKAQVTSCTIGLITTTEVDIKIKGAVLASENRVATFLKQVMEGDVLGALKSILKTELPTIKERLAKLEARPTQQAGLGSNATPIDVDNASRFFSDLGLTDDPAGRALQEPTSSVATHTMDNLVKAVSKLQEERLIDRARMADLESRTEERAVCIGGKWFTSKAAVEAFLVNQLGKKDTGVGMLAVDIVSLLQVMCMDFGSVKDRFDQEYKGTRVEMDNPLYQVIFHSYGVEVPECMGGTTLQAARNPRILAMLDSYAAFNGNGELDDGLKNLWLSELEKLDQSYVGTVERAGLTPDVEKILLQLFATSKSFAGVIFQFMVTQNESYGASTGLTVKSRWLLVQRLLRIVFKELAKVRRKAANITAKNSKNASAEYIWACFQAHRIMAEYVEKGFTNHPSIAPVLTTHMLTIVAFKEDLKKSSDVLAKMQQTADKALKDVQEVASKANTAALAAKEAVKRVESRLPAKKKQKGDDDKE
jgi:hypothetical protein